jgi:hypothetical protein
MSEIETVLIFQREHSNRLEEWVAPHNNVSLELEQHWVYVRETLVGDVDHPTHALDDDYHTHALAGFRHIVEAYLVTRPRTRTVSPVEDWAREEHIPG